jgi:hypothetical protein
MESRPCKAAHTIHLNNEERWLAALAKRELIISSAGRTPKGTIYPAPEQERGWRHGFASPTPLVLPRLPDRDGNQGACG